MKSIFIIFLAWISVFTLSAAKVQRVNTYSEAMDKNMEAVVITPENYSSSKQYAVLYLLHGYSGNQNDWVTQAPEITELSDLYNFIIVCPDGNYSSWYFDSPIDAAWKYETYIARELPLWIDKHFSTIGSRDGRAITGLSMGGHGALYLAFRNQDVFGAAGSMSGGVDIRPFPNNWELTKLLGSYADYPKNWEENAVINLTHKLTPNALSLIIDCGTEDFFYEVNCNLHKKLSYMNIPHDFISRQGEHNWEYWKNAIQYQALFFYRYFSKVS